MTINVDDKVYGREEIKEDVLVELINSPFVQRLKGVAQWGIPSEYYHKKNGFSRYEHSIGALILLRRLDADLTEQVAGLLHDVSHTAFSHVVDWLVGDPTKEDYQDNNHLDIIENSEIPKILERQGFDYKEISDLEKFSLLEKESPSLCVDRVEYSLREISHDGNFGLVGKIISNLTSWNGQVVFRDKEISEIFARKYSQMQNEHWAGNQARARYFIFSNILRKAIENEIIFFEDLNKTDLYVLGLLIKSKDKCILDNLNLLEKGFEIEEVEEGIELKKKFRYIDPEILVGNSIRNLSEVSPHYKSFLEEEKKNSNNYPKIKIASIKNENQ